MDTRHLSSIACLAATTSGASLDTSIQVSQEGTDHCGMPPVRDHSYRSTGKSQHFFLQQDLKLGGKPCVWMCPNMTFSLFRSMCA